MRQKGRKPIKIIPQGRAIFEPRYMPVTQAALR
jgi:hypothetical protein